MFVEHRLDSLAVLGWQFSTRLERQELPLVPVVEKPRQTRTPKYKYSQNDEVVIQEIKRCKPTDDSNEFETKKSIRLKYKSLALTKNQLDHAMRYEYPRLLASLQNEREG